jgi:hypothetical protein
MHRMLPMLPTEVDAWNVTCYLRKLMHGMLPMLPKEVDAQNVTYVTYES